MSPNKRNSSRGKTKDNEPDYFEVVDIQSLSVEAPDKAIKIFENKVPRRKITCDVLVAGGGLGGVAAVLSLLAPDDQPKKSKIAICLTEETDWLGGQVSSQGVSALDENAWVETSGACRNYQEFRKSIREHYRLMCKPPWNEKKNEDPIFEYFNPGNCWVSRLSFEPALAAELILHELSPFIEEGRLEILLRHKIVAIERRKSNITNKIAVSSARAVCLDSGDHIDIKPRMVIDATELGDLLPLSGLPYSLGAESKEQTGEPHAPECPQRETVQDIVFPFIVEFREGENHTIEKPEFYEEFMAGAKFSLLDYKMFESGFRPLAQSHWLEEQDENDENFGVELLPFWTYRRLIDKEYFHSRDYPWDISMINWESNDFAEGTILDVPPAIMVSRLAKAKLQSLGFLYWLQTALAHPTVERTGYPELALCLEKMDTADGLSKFPYIRESRRIIPVGLIRENDIAESFYSDSARARDCSDSVGIGHYPIDIHGKQEPGTAQRTKPFQLPLAALIPQDADNILAGCKNIGVTHIANGAYRLHPVEWAIGTASGALAKASLASKSSPHKILSDQKLLRALQRRLAENGAPIYWYDDIPTTHASFAAIQIVSILGLMRGSKSNLSFGPDEPISKEEAHSIIRLLIGKRSANLPGASEGMKPGAELSTAEFESLIAHKWLRLPEKIRQIASCPGVENSLPVSRATFAQWLYRWCCYRKADISRFAE